MPPIACRYHVRSHDRSSAHPVRPRRRDPACASCAGRSMACPAATSAACSVAGAGCRASPIPHKLDALAAGDRSARRPKRQARVAAKPAIRLDESLPITARADDIVELIREHQVVVIAGETGSGKTTQLPKLCLAAGPRRGRHDRLHPAAPAGRALGGQPRGRGTGHRASATRSVSRCASPTRCPSARLVKFMTDGILLAETQGDPWLSSVRHDHHRRGARAQPQHRFPARLPEAPGRRSGRS